MAWLHDVAKYFRGSAFELRKEEDSLWDEAVMGQLGRPDADLLALYRLLEAPQREVLGARSSFRSPLKAPARCTWR